MNALTDVVNYVLGFKPYVLLPCIILCLSLVFRIPASKAFKASLSIGIGFVGIFIIFNYFIETVGPAVQQLVKRTGLQSNVLDVGWPPMAAVTWSSRLAPLMILLVLLVNILMLLCRLTKTVNIDIWNFWHFIFGAVIVRELTGNTLLAIAAGLVTEILVIKLSDWSAPALKRFSGLSGIAITTFYTVGYYPLGVVGDYLLERVPYLKNWNVGADTIKKKLGLFGEPMFIGFVLGLLLGTGAGYELKKVLQLAVEIAAVIYILPMVCGIVGQALMPISEGMKEFIKRSFPALGEVYIGMDLSIMLGNTSVIVAGLLLMPVALVLSLVMPGVKVIPLAELTNIISMTVIIVVAVRGNIIRALLIGIPILIGKLYISSYMAPVYSSLAHKMNITFDGYDGLVTSFGEGGHLLRFWISQVFAGRPAALLLAPAVLALLYATRRLSVGGSERSPEKRIKIHKEKSVDVY